jgi:hypothetical protein
MLSCYGCKNKNTYACRGCVGWSHYESNTLINPVLAMDIDKEMKMLAKHALNKMFGVESSERRENTMTIKKVYFNDPVTVVLWEDGTKTIVKSGEDDIYDPEKGLAMAIAKKALGNKGNYYEVFKKWLPEEKEEEELSALDELKQALNNLTIPKLSIAVNKDNTEERKVIMLTAEELAEKLGCTKATIQKQCRQGLHPGAVKVGGKWKIPY